MKKIYLDAGHGGADLGAVASGLYEKDLVLAVQQYIISFLSTHYQDFLFVQRVQPMCFCH